jgi:hypothetical protein
MRCQHLACWLAWSMTRVLAVCWSQMRFWKLCGKCWLARLTRTLAKKSRRRETGLVTFFYAPERRDCDSSSGPKISIDLCPNRSWSYLPSGKMEETSAFRLRPCLSSGQESGQRPAASCSRGFLDVTGIPKHWDLWASCGAGLIDYASAWDRIRGFGLTWANLTS